ncbi:hypothetical protein [Geodermatophilus sp. DSM 45219]|uniref:hypothetical protein n=1 Tax=Geodermatophilus sp. DSM 45219 TaxID=1881103 RepID=UPI0008925A2A|nr:hypothetical protein [Geodermatophilus sp. DSM 45219]SDO08130.1 hypothetical protein SAMN05428965_2735 [Geodermatophilus sp. DSM 45219]
MWSIGGHIEPDDELHRRMSPPDNEVPVALPQNLLLGRTDDVAVALLGLQVYSTGVSFDLAVRARAGAVLGAGRSLNELFWEHRPGAAQQFLFGVEFADGRRASNLPGPGRADDVVFHSGGGGGGDTSIDQSWWLSPLPPEGPLRLVVRCPDLDLAESVVELDGSEIQRAAQHVVVLWPWEAPRDHGHEEALPSPDLPADSWFAGR